MLPAAGAPVSDPACGMLCRAWGSLAVADAWSHSERPVERRNPIGVDGEFDGPRFAGDAPDESPLFEPNQHGIHRGWREVEEPLEIRMAGSLRVASG